jgi:HEAT repeat protein
MLGDALARVADERHFEEVVALAKHRRYGKARELVVLALGNMRDPRAITALLELLSDEEVAGYAIRALGKLRAREARDPIATFLKHPNAWVRTEAKCSISQSVVGMAGRW